MLNNDTALLSPPFKRLGVVENDRMELTRAGALTFLLWLLSREDALRPPEDGSCGGFVSTGDAVAESGLEFWLFGTPLGG